MNLILNFKFLFLIRTYVKNVSVKDAEDRVKWKLRIRAANPKYSWREVEGKEELT